MDEKKLWNDISDIVDRWVSTVLRDRLIQGTSDQKPVSLWDKFKQGVTNWWWGKDGEQYNKYKWKNRFGNILGMSESFDPSIFSLEEYGKIKNTIDSVEIVISESASEGDDLKNLKLFKIIRDASETLKKDLFNAVKRHIQIEPSPPPAEEAPVPSVDPTGKMPSKKRGGKPKKIPNTDDDAGASSSVPSAGAKAGVPSRGRKGSTAGVPSRGRKGSTAGVVAGDAGVSSTSSGVPGGVEAGAALRGRNTPKPPTTERKGRNTLKPPPVSNKPGSATAAPRTDAGVQDQTERENEKLKSLLIDNRGQPSSESGKKKFGMFVKSLLDNDDLDQFSKDELKNWWEGKKEELDKKPDGDKLGHLASSLTNRFYTDEIAELTGKEKKEVLSMLLKFIDEEEHGF